MPFWWIEASNFLKWKDVGEQTFPEANGTGLSLLHLRLHGVETWLFGDLFRACMVEARDPAELQAAIPRVQALEASLGVIPPLQKEIAALRAEVESLRGEVGALRTCVGFPESEVEDEKDSTLKAETP